MLFHYGKPGTKIHAHYINALKPMNKKAIHKLSTYCIAVVWIANGLFCKVLNLVPRHQQIVARILGIEQARLWTIAIGCSEIFMAIWILSNIKTHRRRSVLINAGAQKTFRRRTMSCV